MRLSGFVFPVTLGVAMKELFQHTAVTDGITVRVAVNFLPEQSRIEAGKWFWVYHIRIENHSSETVRLTTRHWRITDATGAVNLVEGDGVVGEQPVLKPGDTFEYSSGSSIPTAVGTMRGSYQLVAEDGTRFEASIPEFTLSVPRVLH